MGLSEFIQIDKSGVWVQRRGRLRLYPHRRYTTRRMSRAWLVGQTLSRLGYRRLRLARPACDRWYLAPMIVLGDSIRTKHAWLERQEGT